MDADHITANKLTSITLQLLDEARLSRGKIEEIEPFKTFPSSLLNADVDAFQKYLKSRSDAICSALLELYSQPVAPTPDQADFQKRISQLLTKERNHVIELEKSRLEMEQMEERLETASMRYMMAEKKLDRAKSLTVAKLERQATAGGRSESGSGLGGGVESNKNDATNGQADNGDSLVEAETARKEAVAISNKQRLQLEQIAAENEKLTAEVTALHTRLSHLTDDDYARTDLFKHLKSQHEDVIRRINNLEATNVELRQEAMKLQEERTAYQIRLDTESQAAITQREDLVNKAENDLARIRAARDELHADIQTRKAAQDQEKASINQIKQLTAAKDDRIKALESEMQRRWMDSDQANGSVTDQADNEHITSEELRIRYRNLERQYAMLNDELSSMGTAFKKASTAASQKTNHLSNLEEKLSRLTAEKSKADQKYFAAMKSKETMELQVRTLRAQNSKSSEIVSQLKDAEAAARTLVVNLEKQVVEVKEALSTITKQQRISQQQCVEKNIIVEGLKAQVDELKTTLTSKDSSISTVSSAARKAEIELEELRVRLEETKKSLDMWKTKGLGNQSGEYEMLRVRRTTSLLGMRLC